MTKRIIKIFLKWLPLGATIFLLCGFVSLVVQQNYRSGLNDPQIQMAEDGVTALVSGKVPADIVPRSDLFDMGKSLAPWIAVYDSSGTPLESSAYLNDAPPKPPIGIFEYAEKTGRNIITWQPDAQTRIALAVFPVDNGSGYFVVAGRNMREVEAREHKLMLMTLLAILGTWFVSFSLYFIIDFLV